MAAIRFKLGASARLVAKCKVDGSYADPTALTLTIEGPDNVEVAHVYGTDANVIKDATGRYHYDLSLVTVGTYRWRWVGTGTCIGADDGSITVRGGLA